MTRASRMLAVAGIAVLALTGCSGTVRAGAAAVVGDERITTSELQEVVERGLDDPSAQQTVGSDRAAFERSVLARMIQHLVLTEAARDLGVVVDGATVDKAFDKFATQLGGEENLRAEAAKAGIGPKDLRGAITDAALRDALGDKLTEKLPIVPGLLEKAYQDGIAQFDRVRSAHILVASPVQAQQLLQQVQADPSTFTALAAQHSLDTSNKAIGGDLGFQGRGALEKPFEEAIFSAKPGTFVLARTSFGSHVIHVIERQTTSFEQATPELRRTLLAVPRSEAIRTLLDKTARKLDISVNPRFGAFDIATEDVTSPLPCKATAHTSPMPRPDEGGGEPQPSPSPGC